MIQEMCPPPAPPPPVQPLSQPQPPSVMLVGQQQEVQRLAPPNALSAPVGLPTQQLMAAGPAGSVGPVGPAAGSPAQPTLDTQLVGGSSQPPALAQQQALELPTNFFCPLMGTVMRDPVIDGDGFRFYWRVRGNREYKHLVVPCVRVESASERSRSSESAPLERACSIFLSLTSDSSHAATSGRPFRIIWRAII